MYFILYIMQAWTPNLYFVSIWITTRIQRSFFLRYSRHTVLPTKPRKLFQRPVELFIWIHENTWESSNSRLFFETFSVKHNVHFLWGQRKRIFFFFLLCFVQDLYNLDLSDDIVTIGSLDDGDGQVSVTRSYAFSSWRLQTRVQNRLELLAWFCLSVCSLKFERQTFR